MPEQVVLSSHVTTEVEWQARIQQEAGFVSTLTTEVEQKCEIVTEISMVSRLL